MKYATVYESGLFSADFTRQDVIAILMDTPESKWESKLRQEVFFNDGFPQYYIPTTENKNEADQAHNDIFRMDISGDYVHIACEMTEGYTARILQTGDYEYDYGSSLDYEYMMTPEQKNALKELLKINRQDIEEYAQEWGSQAAADLLLLAGSDGYSGGYEEYNALMESFEKGEIK